MTAGMHSQSSCAAQMWPLYLPPLTWSMQYGHSSDAVLLVLTSDAYNRAGYISEYREFCKIMLASGRE